VKQFPDGIAVTSYEIWSEPDKGNIKHYNCSR
jgi:hypothetical protein